MKISICGKGGSGKSTIVTLLAKVAREKDMSVLVVDSDESNSGLFQMLGFEGPPIPLMELVGGKSSLKKKLSEPDIFQEPRISVNDIPPQYIQNKDNLAIVSIGKILQSLEGCACPMGVLNREFLKKLHLKENEVAIVDMEAGVEHFGRGVDESIDRVVLVAEPSFESISVAEKIQELAVHIKKRVYAVLNKVPSQELASKLEDKLNKKGIEVIGSIPYDPVVFEACLEGKPINNGDAIHASARILDGLLAERKISREKTSCA